MKVLPLLALPVVISISNSGFAEETPELANPAAAFCVETGGEYQIVKEADGARGTCRLPDGTTVDAWDHFRENWDKAPKPGLN